jgi:hypothetical protein
MQMHFSKKHLRFLCHFDRMPFCQLLAAADYPKGKGFTTG